MAKKSKKDATPLTQRCLDDLKTNGAATSDGIAQRVGAKAVAVVKALSALKARELVHFKADKSTGENVWRKGRGIVATIKRAIGRK